MSKKSEDISYQLGRRHVALFVAINGPNVKHPDEHPSMEDLLYKVGQMRRDIENAHAWLDLRNIPRKSGDSELTLRGRLEKIVEAIIDELH